MILGTRILWKWFLDPQIKKKAVGIQNIGTGNFFCGGGGTILSGDEFLKKSDDVLWYHFRLSELGKSVQRFWKAFNAFEKRWSEVLLYGFETDQRKFCTARLWLVNNIWILRQHARYWIEQNIKPNTNFAVLIFVC